MVEKSPQLQPFTGRKKELKLLKNIANKRTSSLVAIKGRRRIGKSRLIDEFAAYMQDYSYFRFSGLAPDSKMTAQDQRDAFTQQLSQQTNLPQVNLDNWTDCFQLLINETVNIDSNKSKHVIILFDEITWMAHDDPSFMSKLRDAWELSFKKNPTLIFILCGSISNWIEKNIISNTGYFGRISLDLNLEELSLIDSNNMFNNLGFNRSAIEKLNYLALTGGVPWYLEQVLPQYSALENIKNLCFRKDALFVKEYKRIFHDLFGNQSDFYQKIIQQLSIADLDYTTLSEKIQYAKGSSLTEYLDNLIAAGYIHKYRSWSLRTAKESNKSARYRITDNYLRFYFKYLIDKTTAIQKDRYQSISVASLPGWDSVIGLQIENLVIKNHQLIEQALNIHPLEIIADGPFFQAKTTRAKGCQIDYLIQTKHQALYVCEIKFSSNKHGMEVVEKMKEKISRMSLPRGYVTFPVLIYVGELTQSVIDSEYFYKTINLAELMGE